MDDKVAKRRAAVAEAEARIYELEARGVGGTELELARRSLALRRKMLAQAVRQDPHRGLRLVRNEGMELLRALIREVVIAGEVDTASLYSDYRPSDPKEYLGMVLGVDDDEEGGDYGGNNGGIADAEPLSVDVPEADAPEVAPTGAESTDTVEVEIEPPKLSI